MSEAPCDNCRHLEMYSRCAWGTRPQDDGACGRRHCRPPTAEEQNQQILALLAAILAAIEDADLAAQGFRDPGEPR